MTIKDLEKEIADLKKQLTGAKEVIRASLDLVGLVNSGREEYDYRVSAEEYLEDNK